LFESGGGLRYWILKARLVHVSDDSKRSGRNPGSRPELVGALVQNRGWMATEGFL
jgi:hypothetical protein